MNLKTGLTAAIIGALAAAPVAAEDIKIGVLLGFTGPIESTVANMAPGAELAIKEVSDSGKLLGGAKVMPYGATALASTQPSRPQPLSV